MTAESITDIDIIRWAYVEVLMQSDAWNSAIDERTRKLIAGELHALLLTASPEQLMNLLNIEDLAFAEKVSECVRQNEKSRTNLQ